MAEWAAPLRATRPRLTVSRARILGGLGEGGKRHAQKSQGLYGRDSRRVAQARLQHHRQSECELACGGTRGPRIARRVARDLRTLSSLVEEACVSSIPDVDDAAPTDSSVLGHLAERGALVRVRTWTR